MRPRFLPLASLLAACAAAPPGADGAAEPAEAGTLPGADGGREAEGDALPPDRDAGGATGDARASAGVKSGVLLFGTSAPIEGLSYASGSQTGTTDASGTFRYESGKPVTFRAGDLVLGAPQGGDVLSPYPLAANDSCDDSDDLKKVVAVLEALDTDHTPANGIKLPASPSNGPIKLLSQTSWADLGGIVPALPAPLEALRAFIAVFDGEAWMTIATDAFGAPSAALRGQGVTTDGTSWFFSGTTGLERTDTAYASTASNPLAIPVALVIAGSDHIGDIDYWSGKLYAPIEDKKYQAPKVVLFDPTSLSSGTVFSISATLQTKGVPWIAVDGPRAVAYMAEWDPTPGINVFALNDMSFVRTIDLSRATGRVQGGKVYKRQLYLTVDDDQKRVYKVHLASGTLLEVLTLGLSGMELEGLAFLTRPDGSSMHTSNVNAARNGVDFRHHKITREPLRWKTCP